MKTKYTRNYSDESSKRPGGRKDNPKGNKGHSAKNENSTSRNSSKKIDGNKGPFRGKRNQSGPNRGTNYKRRTRFFQKSSDELFRKLDKLFDAYLVARKKFFEGLYRPDEEQRIKLKNDFYNSLQNLRKHENFLYKHYRGLLQERSCSYRPDRTYQNNHREGQNDEAASDHDEKHDNFSFSENIHLLPSQIDRENYKEDSCESSGDMSDYSKFKTEKTW